MIYSAVARLRDLLPIKMDEGMYMFPKEFIWVHLSQDRHHSMSLSARQKKVLNLLESQGSLKRKDLVEHLEISERTALRELSQLVSMGLLSQFGAGRGVYYLKWNQGA